MTLPRITIALLALVIAASAGLAAPGFVAASSVPDGWEIAAEPKTFDGETLYEHINGAAPGYTRFDFRLLTVEPVRLVEDPKVEILVEVYEFGNHLDAFGIYSNERMPTLDFEKLGAEGYFAGPACRFYRGNYYVKLNGSRANDEVAAAERQIATALAKSLKGSARRPAILAAVPQSNIVVNSERYEGSDLLAHDFLGAGFTADYDIGGEKTSKLWFAAKDSPQEAREAYYQLLRFMRKRGEVGESLSLATGRGRLTEHPFYGPSLVCRKDNVVCGVLRVPGADSGVELVDALMAGLADTD
ncbi:MAG TPA: DUF6599 family protein [Armatimonadota bacterium]|nr:DUF6599 family protein [Armatimonadota bacterium]